MIGLLPASYIEVSQESPVLSTCSTSSSPAAQIVSRDGARTPSKRPSEGQARAKYNFQAQSGVELSLNKGELVTLTRRVDGNWFEGKIANRKGIFPVSYVEVTTSKRNNQVVPSSHTFPSAFSAGANRHWSRGYCGQDHNNH